MKILTSDQIRQWDAITIVHEPVTSVNLMERAASRCIQWLEENNYLPGSFTVYCGKGNNGGDGLAIARMLSGRPCRVTVYILQSGHQGSADFQANLLRLDGCDVKITHIRPENLLDPVPAGDVIIDALFGSGLNRPPDDVTTRLIAYINQSGNEVIAIDIPSGMYADTSSKGQVMVKAVHTLSFQCYKIAFLLPENESWFGKVHILDIGLSPGFPGSLANDLELLDTTAARAIYRPRKSFSHKGTFGHSLTIAGSFGKMGAAVLTARASLRTGSGLHSCMLPGCGYVIMQVSVPEAMAMADPNDRYITGIPDDVTKYSAIGIGPGLGTEAATADALHQVLTGCNKPIVIDADALNLLADRKEWFPLLPPLSILTPHPKEFERLFGASANDFERLQTARAKASEWNVIIVLKGHHTFIAIPGGSGFFNTTGNAGMATGGSGDVLTGIITSLLAQQYQPKEAALLGVFLHGLAGDLAAATGTEESLIASDIVESLGSAYKQIGSV